MSGIGGATINEVIHRRGERRVSGGRSTVCCEVKENNRKQGKNKGKFHHPFILIFHFLLLILRFKFNNLGMAMRVVVE